jgi:NTE family protein
MFTLVLAGGGARGLSHLGVLRRFEENGLHPNFIVGTSMGAIVGGAYSLYGSSSYVINNLYYLLKKINNFKIDLDAAFTGKIDVNKYVSSILCQLGILRKYISSPKKYKKALYLIFKDADIQDTKIKFMAISTDLKAAKPVKHLKGRMVDEVFISATLPGFFPAVKRNGKLLVDGGVVANLPVIEAREELPSNKVIAVNLNSNTTLQTSSPFSIMATIDNLKERMINDIEMANADYVINIDVSHVNIGDFSKYREAIRAGYRQSERHIQRIKEIMK